MMTNTPTGARHQLLADWLTRRGRVGGLNGTDLEGKSRFSVMPNDRENPQITKNSMSENQLMAARCGEGALGWGWVTQVTGQRRASCQFNNNGHGAYSTA